MARPVSTIESHPQRQKIIDALVQGQTLHQIAAWAEPKVTESAICRWRRKITLQTANAIDHAKALIANSDSSNSALTNQAANRAAMIAATDPFLSRVLELRRERAEVKGEARSEGDLRAFAALDRNDLSELELEARLTGRLEGPAAGTTTIYITMAAAPPSATPAPAAPIPADWTVAPDGSAVPEP